MLEIINRIRFYLRIFLDKETPLYVKSLLGVALIYLLFPFDFLPDTIPMFGLIDDLSIGTVLLLIALKLVPEKVISRVSKEILED